MRWVFLNIATLFAFGLVSSCSLVLTGQETAYKTYVITALATRKALQVYELNLTTGDLPLVQTQKLEIAPKELRHFDGQNYFFANTNTGVISSLSINGATGAVTTIDQISLGIPTLGPTVHPSTNFAFLGNVSDELITGLRINRNTGEFESIGSPISGAYPGSIGFASPTLNILYTVGYNDFTLYSFNINTVSGNLTLTSSFYLATFPTPPMNVIVDPLGRFIYSCDETLSIEAVVKLNPPSGAITTDENMAGFTYIDLVFLDGGSSAVTTDGGNLCVSDVKSSSGEFFNTRCQVTPSASVYKLLLDSSENFLFAIDSNNNKIHRYSSSGANLTYLGTLSLTADFESALIITTPYVVSAN